VAIFFGIRNDFLNCHVFMRSSDVWLGVPYDVFTFSMLTHLVCGLLNDSLRSVQPGQLYLTAASSHLYEANWADARLCLASPVKEQSLTPTAYWLGFPGVAAGLKALRDTKPGDPLRWWEA
jgi:thymidylate synthase